MIVLDSSAFIGWARNAETAVADAARRLVDVGTPFAITDVVYAELLAGSPTTGERNALDTLLHRGQVLRLESIRDFERAADCSRAAQQAGLTVRSMADCLIASVCIREGAVLLHDDRDFTTLSSCTDLHELVP